MRLTEKGLFRNIDWLLVMCYLVLAAIGIINIYASIHSTESGSILDYSGRSGKQFMWLMVSLAAAVMIVFVFNPRIYESLSVPIYLAMILLLVAVIFLGSEAKGSRSWFEFGHVKFQPAEVSKISTSLLLATVMSQFGFKMGKIKDFLTVAAIIVLPMLIIILQNETGSTLVYVGFAFVLYREGLSGWLLFMIGMAIVLFIMTLTVSPYMAIIFLLAVTTFCDAVYSGKLKGWAAKYLPALVVLGFVPTAIEHAAGLFENPEDFMEAADPIYILAAVMLVSLPVVLFHAYRRGNTFTYFAAAAVIAGTLLVFSTEFIFNDVLQDHQRKRIEVLLGMKEDPSGVGYNVNQSMIAIGSGGLAGKGYLNGTQTTYGFVPEQSTDFIFCTVGEEWGFLGSTAVILIYVFMIWRIVHNAEKSKEAFTRIYGYCVASCIFMHLFINIGMTIGIMPVIGIPLPFVSYGGSSLLAFTVLLFIFIALDGNDKRYSN
ncbi:MAG: rod shape-determining protein RodA [Bacteroidales bacterium]|nr:rod shape-determining protein RodA [Bacteroidales bacterium]MDE7127243.1 rod shape-determining protein RodA [Bacteroidales bacterium]